MCCAGIEGVLVRNRKKPWNGRAHVAPAEALFERALFGVDECDDKRFNPREDRKTLQLCRQVQCALAMALSGECGDEILRDLYVESVEPMGSASQLIVRVVIPANLRCSLVEVMSKLDERAVRLRALVAQAICRKRVPNLTFIVVPSIGNAMEGGVP
jgi:ribosome-binding factor A